MGSNPSGRARSAFPKRTYGALAQLGAHNTGSVGVRGSNPLCSTKNKNRHSAVFVFAVASSAFEPPQMPLAAFDMLCAPAKQQIRSEARRKAGVTNPRANCSHRASPFGGFCFCCRKFGIRTPSKAEWLLTCFAPLQSNKFAQSPAQSGGYESPGKPFAQSFAIRHFCTRTVEAPTPTGWQKICTNRRAPSVSRRSHLRRNTNEKSEGIPFGFFWWTIKGSNLGPAGYEPAALTN